MTERIGRYLKAAFTYHWNLLFVGVGAAVAVISGRPDVVVPLVAAGELLYLATLTTNERFQAAVDAQDAKARHSSDAASTRVAYERIRSQLPPHLVERFDQLREHCLKLTDLAKNIRSPEATGPDSGAIESLERLLWGHLRMIWNAAKLSEFLEHTDDESLERRIKELEKRLAGMPTGDANAALRSAVEDNLHTTRERLANIAEAKNKLDVVAAEIERLETKIAALAEGAVARRDVSDIARRVDEVAEGMRRTDETMRHLQLPPELEEIEAPPALLRDHA